MFKNTKRQSKDLFLKLSIFKHDSCQHIELFFISDAYQKSENKSFKSMNETTIARNKFSQSDWMNTIVLKFQSTWSLNGAVITHKPAQAFFQRKILSDKQRYCH